LNDLKQNKKYYKKRPKRYEKTYIEINKLIINQTDERCSVLESRYDFLKKCNIKK
jgi:L-2-hydroxyglutarate oxidase LhgO